MQNEIKEKIENTLKAEADALLNLSNHVTPDMCAAVYHILNSKGRLIITGIGKSAIVAQKMVATFNSTGTNAIFMHAADAIHGDLGMIKEEDIVMCISKSGDTPEIKVLVPLIKGFGNTLISMVSNQQSYLATQADFVIHLPMQAEADPNNLAPTTSTTLQVAMGDALAVSLLSIKGFSPEHFAKFHPGGSLGKQLYLKVSDLIVHNERPKVYLHDSIKKIILEISSRRLGATAVLDDNENLKGIITDGDLRRMLELQANVSHILAQDIMNPNPKLVQIDSLAVDALVLMRKYCISQLLVVDGLRYKGIVHIHDLIREGIM